MDAKNAMTTTSGAKKEQSRKNRIAEWPQLTRRYVMYQVWRCAVTVTERYENNIKMPTAAVPADKLKEPNSIPKVTVEYFGT